MPGSFTFHNFSSVFLNLFRAKHGFVLKVLCASGQILTVMCIASLNAPCESFSLLSH